MHEKMDVQFLNTHHLKMNKHIKSVFTWFLTKGTYQNRKPNVILRNFKDILSFINIT